MTDPTVVSLCRQYLQTWDAAILPLLCDRLEEIGPADVAGWHRWHWCRGVQLVRYPNTVADILKQYGGEP